MIELKKRSSFVGEFIKGKRQALGLSQRALGSAMVPPVTTQFISNIERGVTPLPPGHIQALVQILAVSEQELLRLLEKDFTTKLNGRLGKQDPPLSQSSAPHTGDAGSQLPQQAVHTPSHTPLTPHGEAEWVAFMVARADLAWLKKLYESYRLADTSTRDRFLVISENALKLS